MAHALVGWTCRWKQQLQMERRLDTEFERDTSVNVDIATVPATASAIEPLDRSALASHSLVIQIRIARHLAGTHSENAAAICPHLECPVNHFELGGKYGYQQLIDIRRFYWRDADCLFFPAGLVPRIANELTQQGFHVDILDHTRWSQHSRVDRSLLTDATLEPSRRDLLTAVTSSARGQLVVRSRIRPEVAGTVCKLFPMASILIVVTNRQEEQHFANRLAEQLDRPVCTNANRNFSPPDKVFVVTTSIFSCVNDLDWNIVIFASPEAAFSKQSYYRASFLEDQLLYCLTPPDYHSDRYTQLRLESICGPEIWSEVEQLAAVHVAFITVPSSSVQTGSIALARKSQAIWDNVQRNDAIAELATAIVTGNAQTFSPRSENLTQQLSQLCPGWRTAILVESPEHGRQLIKRLPDWELITAIPGRDGCVEDASGPNHLEIVTEAIAAMDGIEADVIVVASGLASMARHFPPQRAEPVLVVEFADDFDDQAREATQQRREAYTQRGWTVTKDQPVAEGGVQ